MIQQQSFTRGTSGFLSSHCRGIEPHLALRGESRGISCVVVGNFEFLYSFVGDIREPLMLPQGSQASFLVAWGTSGFLLSHYRGIGPHLELRRETQTRVFFPLSCDRYLGEPLELHLGSQACFQVLRGNLGLLSRPCRGNRPHSH